MRLILLFSFVTLLLSCKNKKEAQPIYVYPNPASTDLNVHVYPNNESMVDIRIVGTNIERSVYGLIIEEKFDISSIKQGTYLIEVFENGKILTSSYFKKI